MKHEYERFWFTVGKLRELLKKYPDNMPVVISGQENGYENFFLPHEIEVIHQPDNYYKQGEFQIIDEKTDEEVFTALAFTRVTRD